MPQRAVPIRPHGPMLGAGAALELLFGRHRSSNTLFGNGRFDGDANVIGQFTLLVDRRQNGCSPFFELPQV